MSLSMHVLIAIGVVGIASGIVGVGREFFALHSEFSAAKSKLEALRNKKTLLSARIAELETPQAIEREAKENLNLKKKGEAVVVVVPERTAQATSSPATWRLWLRDFFGGIFRRAE